MSETDRPRRKKRRPAQARRIDLVSPLLAAGAALLLLGVSFGLSEVIRYTTNRPPPQVAGPSPGQPTQPGGSRPADVAWNAPPDPNSQPVPTLPPGPGVPVGGEALFASLGGLFFVDTPPQGSDLAPARVAEEPGAVPVHDLAAGKPLGTLPKEALRGKGSLLGPDGRFLITHAPPQVPNDLSLFAIWPLDAQQSTGFLYLAEGVFWIDFIGPDEVAVATHSPLSSTLRVFRLSTNKRMQFGRLPDDAFPPVPRGTFPKHQPDPLIGAISPGRKYVALGGATGIVILTLADCKPVATLPVPGEGDKVEYRGLRFSADGTELSGVFAFAHAGKEPDVRLRTWSMTDGTVSLDVKLANPDAYGPPLRGHEPGTALLLAQRLVGGKPARLGRVVDTRTGATLRELPHTPVRRLGAGRMLVVGPISDAPPGTPLRVGGEEKQRDDPAVRAVYPVSLPQPAK